MMCECGNKLVSSDFGHYCDNKECEHYDVDVLAFKIFEMENIQEEIEAFKRVEAKERRNVKISVV